MDLEEISHIVISVVTISIAFAIALTGTTDVTPAFAASFTGIFFTVGLGFLLHEMAHKYVAIHYGAYARYRAWTLGLVAALLLAVFLGFVFAAPGAVYIYGRHLNLKQYGKIALAGPLMNYVLAFLFFALASGAPGLQEMASYGVYINLFLAGFNLIPFGPFDGAKVYAWSKGVWLAAIVPAFVLILLLPKAF